MQRRCLQPKGTGVTTSVCRLGLRYEMMDSRMALLLLMQNAKHLLWREKRITQGCGLRVLEPAYIGFVRFTCTTNDLKIDCFIPYAFFGLLNSIVN